MMLHIGCGNSRILEFTNIDCRPTSTTDIVAPAWDLQSIADESVEYIYARHMFEHLSCDEAARTLAEWYRVSALGGIVHLVVPNIEFHARQLLGLAQSLREDQQAHALAGFYGWQRDDPHRWGYTTRSLADLLGNYGFSITDAGIDQLCERDVEPWHINLRVEK
jgi:predicted SAM-dependent methyltransferase